MTTSSPSAVETAPSIGMKAIAQEFKQRREYVPQSSTAPTIVEGDSCNCTPENIANVEAPAVEKVMLFTSPTCPNCKMAKMLLDKDHVNYENVDAATNKELTEAYGIKQAPTLLVPDGDSYKVYENASLIKGYLESLKSRK